MKVTKYPNFGIFDRSSAFHHSFIMKLVQGEITPMAKKKTRKSYLFRKLSPSSSFFEFVLSPSLSEPESFAPSASTHSDFNACLFFFALLLFDFLFQEANIRETCTDIIFKDRKITCCWKTKCPLLLFLWQRLHLKTLF